MTKSWLFTLVELFRCCLSSGLPEEARAKGCWGSIHVISPKYIGQIYRILAFLAFTAPSLLAQDDSYALKVDVSVVSVDVMVSDAEGVLVNDLKKSDFQIFEDGTPHEIRFFSPMSAPYNVFLLFDRSGSTREDWPFMQEAVVEFIENLRPQDSVALGSFDDNYDVHLPWTSDRRRAVLALGDVMKDREVNGTRFYAALERTLRREFEDTVGRRAVVVLTDGKDSDYSCRDPEELMTVLNTTQERGIPVYVIGLEEEAFRRVRQPRMRQYLLDIHDNMQLLAERSGGKVFFPKTADDFIPMYAQVGRT